MNKADKIFIGIVLIVVCLLYIPSLWNAYQNKGKAKAAVVSYKNEEVLRIDMKVDKDYEVQGSLGPVHIEVKDEKVRVEKENSPYHLCSIQGWVSDANMPIVCLPNNIVVVIETSDTSSSDDVDTVIQ